MVDIVNRSLRVDEFHEILDNLDDVLTRQHAHFHVGAEVELLVDAVASHFAQVVALLREEEVVDDLACRSVVGGVGVTQLAVDKEDSFLLRVGGVLLERIENDGVVRRRALLVVNEDALCARLEDILDVFLVEHRFAVEDHLVTLDGNHFARVFVHEVLHPALQHACGELAAEHLLQVRLVHLHLFGEVENLEDILVRLEADGAEQCSHGQLLLAVDVGIHHVVDVRGELNPGALEGDDTRRVELRTVGVDARAEEHARRAVQLRHHHTFGTVDDERAVVRHVGDRAQEHILHHGIEVLVVRVGTIELEFGLEGHTVGQSAFETFLDRIARFIDIVVDKFQHKVVASVSDGEVLGKNFVQAVVLAQFARRV